MPLQIHIKTGVKSVPVLLFAWLIFSQATHTVSFTSGWLFSPHGNDIRTVEIKEIVLDDNTRFSYTKKQVEITNVLGATVAFLDEYFITNSSGEAYILYKPKRVIGMIYQKRIKGLIIVF